RRHTSFSRDWSSDVCSSDLGEHEFGAADTRCGRSGALHVPCEGGGEVAGGGVRRLRHASSFAEMVAMGKSPPKSRGTEKLATWWSSRLPSSCVTRITSPGSRAGFGRAVMSPDELGAFASISLTRAAFWQAIVDVSVDDE